MLQPRSSHIVTLALLTATFGTSCRRVADDNSVPKDRVAATTSALAGDVGDRLDQSELHRTLRRIYPEQYERRTELVESVLDAVDKLLEEDNSAVIALRAALNKSNDPAQLGKAFAEVIHEAYSQVSELQLDQPGYDGNVLRTFIDNERSTQFNCDMQALLVIDTLNYMKKRLQEGGDEIVNALHFEPGDCEGSHTGVAVRISRMEGAGELLVIIDPWLSPANEPPLVFTSQNDWGSAYQEFVEKELQQADGCRDRMEIRDRRFGVDSEAFHQRWIEQHQPGFTYNTAGEVEHIFNKYYASKDSVFRSVITPELFDYMRDKIGYCLETAGMLSTEELRVLEDLSVKDLPPAKLERVWSKLAPFLSRYYQFD